MRRVLAAMAKQALDPFQGMVERHVMPPAMTSVDMELAAARAAIADAGVDLAEIDLVVAHTPVPEWLGSNPSCLIHAALGLRPDCMAVQIDASGNSFLAQLTLAERLLATGRARHALLVQSAAGSRLLDPEDVQSPLFGDGAAAQVLGPVDAPSILALVHRTDGSHPRALVATVRDGRWYDGGRITLHRGDLADARMAFLETLDRARDVIEPALARAGVSAPVTQGYLAGASVPFVLDELRRSGALRPGDLVAMLGGGVGATQAAAIVRWTL